jgi:hypothetical protein
MFLITYTNLGGGFYLKEKGFQAMAIWEMALVVFSIVCDKTIVKRCEGLLRQLL